jgi:hypothetical protein
MSKLYLHRRSRSTLLRNSLVARNIPVLIRTFDAPTFAIESKFSTLNSTRCVVRLQISSRGFAKKLSLRITGPPARHKRRRLPTRAPLSSWTGGVSRQLDIHDFNSSYAEK